MTDEEQDAKLLEMATERGYITGRKRCTHEEQTLCVHTEPEIGTFVAYQCDLCGMVTRREVTADDMERPNLPPIDGELWNEALRASLGDKLETTLTFWQKAIRV